MTLKAEREVIERTLRENVADISKGHTMSGLSLPLYVGHSWQVPASSEGLWRCG